MKKFFAILAVVFVIGCDDGSLRKEVTVDIGNNCKLISYEELLQAGNNSRVVYIYVDDIKIAEINGNFCMPTVTIYDRLGDITHEIE